MRFIRAPAGQTGFLRSGYIFEEKRKAEDSETAKYDKMAFKDRIQKVRFSLRIMKYILVKYLGMVCFPLMICYMIYSIIYNEHKGWYSFCLQSAYGFLLTFGFIAMTPQLFINYKVVLLTRQYFIYSFQLKSTAHLPWRMMTYKALNTFIDDLFAFIIKMPTLYRLGNWCNHSTYHSIILNIDNKAYLGTLRDDVIFFIYLYQKWIYPTDMKRTNEFGITGDQAEGNESIKEVTAEDSTQDDGSGDKDDQKKPILEKKND